jgi:small subunit ribosomal protein S21
MPRLHDEKIYNFSLPIGHMQSARRSGRFKRKVQTEDIIKEVKRHSFYLKPGAKRRVKQALARKRARKKIRKESE